MTPEEVTVRLHRAMAGATGLPPEDADSSGRTTRGLRGLCTQIYEYEISLDPDLVHQLMEVGLAIGAEERYSDLLRDEG